MIGKIINNYIVEKKLGEGGMGNVYLARHNRVDRIVAIKILHQNLFENESIRNRFKNEANALIKLGHPNIVKIYDYVEQDDFACLIMEYIDGYTLDDYITKVSGPLVASKALNIICKVLDAVQYAHDNNIYHRDIKPGNIMLSRDGSAVRIMDFGIAKIIDSAAFKVTHANAQLGTPFYMSPEQVKGLPYTVLSDIYSLGVTLFEMITGKCPYQAITNLFELQSKIVNEPLPPTNFYYPHVPQYLQDAITRATKKEPRERFPSCTAFKSFLIKQSAVVPETPVAEPKKIIKKPEPVKDTRKSSQEINIPVKIKEPKPVSAGNTHYTIPTVSSTGNPAPPLPMPEPEIQEPKRKRWIIPVTVAALLLISGFIYLHNKKDSTGGTTPPDKKDSITTRTTVDTAKTNIVPADTIKAESEKGTVKAIMIPPPPPPIVDRTAQANCYTILNAQMVWNKIKDQISCEGEYPAGIRSVNINLPPCDQILKAEEGDVLNILLIFKKCHFRVPCTKGNAGFTCGFAIREK